MGGNGSGRHGRRPNARALTDDRQRLDVCALRRAGWRLEAGEGDDDGAAIVLRVEGAPAYTCRPVEPGAALEGGPAAPAGACAIGRLEGAAPPVRVAIDWRRVGYGWRPWWICPACGCRARLVYAPRWTCRTCERLAYRSTRLPEYMRAELRARRAAAALGIPQAWRMNRSALHALPAWHPRPPGMHWRTWRRRLEAWQAARLVYGAALAAELARGWGGTMLAPGFGAMRADALALLATLRAERRAARAAS